MKRGILSACGFAVRLGEITVKPQAKIDFHPAETSSIVHFPSISRHRLPLGLPFLSDGGNRSIRTLSKH
jgi:hypothetical protein